MPIDQSIFKAYDIRGIYPDQIDADLVYKIAQAYVKFLGTRKHADGNADQRGSFRIAVGHDMRLSGEEFKNVLIKGLTNAGVDVVDLGLISTDTLYFAVPFLGADGGLQATASHNPKEFGGLKMVREQGRPISGDTGIYEIRDMVVSDQWQVTSDKKGNLTEKNISDDYFKHVLKSFDVSSFKPLKIVANPNFGMAGVAIKKLKELLPVEFIEVINGELDGTFPKGRPDPLVPENRGEIEAEIKKLHPDLGVAWDADADRCFFFDEQGTFVTPAYASALFAEYYLQKNPGAKILHDTRVVRVIDDAVKKNGGQIVMNKAGHSFIKERMINEQIVFGCETSGHYYFKDNYYLDNGLFPFLAMLDILSKANRPFSEVLKPLREQCYISEEINTKFNNQNILEDIKQHYRDAQIDNIDGYDFNYPDWRFNVRKSNTENLLRLNMEANSQQLLDEKLAEVKGFIEISK